MTGTHPLSAVIITFNEARNIGRCLKSLRDVADDILVVDSFSSDNTIEIAKSYGARVIQNKFEGYIQQKNFANSQALNDFILSLDADEELDDKLRSEIVKIKANSRADAYALNRLTNYCGRWVRHCWYPDYNIRLYNRCQGKWTGNTPHEWFQLNQEGSLVPKLKGNILHYSYYTVKDHFRKVEFYTDLAAKSLHEKNKSAKAFQLLINPFWTFLKMYFFKMGFLDGRSGLQICGISAYASYLKYKKLLALQRLQ
ncbi:MAG: glycosyltransferase family 2 protein [Saprospiraceae bacterium]|nr:glycosyltransferase family 2 protein [Saprospiraceae bacterium]